MQNGGTMTPMTPMSVTRSLQGRPFYGLCSGEKFHLYTKMYLET